MMQRLAAPAIIAVASLIATLAVPAAPSSAQVLRDDVSAQSGSVRSRARPEYDAEGMNLGQALFGSDRQVDPETGLRLYTRVADSMIIKPSLLTELEYDDNILDSSTFKRSDVILRLRPRIDLRSDWDNHEFRAHVALTEKRNRENRFEDATLWDLGLGGRIDVTEFHEVDLAASVVQTQERLISQDLLTNGGNTLSVTSFYPIPLSTQNAVLAWNYQRDLFLSRLRVNLTKLDFQNVPAASNPADQNQDDRDRFEYSVTWRAGYEAYEETTLYVEPALNMRRYVIVPDDAGFKRDSEGGQILFGVLYNATAITFIDAAVGYQFQQYDDPRLQNLSGPTARLSMTWNPTDLLTVVATLERALTEQVSNNAGGQTTTRFALSADQEVYYRTIASAGYQVQHDDTSGNDQVAGYTQTTHNLDLGLKYWFNEYAFVEGFVRHTNATASLPSLEYNSTSIGVSVDLHI